MSFSSATMDANGTRAEFNGTPSPPSSFRKTNANFMRGLMRPDDAHERVMPLPHIWTETAGDHPDYPLVVGSRHSDGTIKYRRNIHILGHRVASPDPPVDPTYLKN